MGIVSPQSQLLCQGAESKVYKDEFLGKSVIIKERFSKKYRHPILDSDLRKTRTRCEARNIAKTRAAGLRAPHVVAIRVSEGVIVMEHIKGETVAAFLQNADEWTESQKAFAIGRSDCTSHESLLLDLCRPAYQDRSHDLCPS